MQLSSAQPRHVKKLPPCGLVLTCKGEAPITDAVLYGQGDSHWNAADPISASYRRSIMNISCGIGGRLVCVVGLAATLAMACEDEDDPGPVPPDTGTAGSGGTGGGAGTGGTGGTGGSAGSGGGGGTG